MKLKHFSMIATILAMLQGCATYKFDYEFDKSIPSFSIVDSRPDNEKANFKMPAGGIQNCSYGIFTLGDGQVSPDRLLVLQDKLSRNFSRQLSGKTIVVKRFAVSNNNQESTRSTAAGLSGGILTSAILRGQSETGCWADSKIQGGFDTSENPTRLPAIVSEIVITVEGHEYTSRQVVPYRGALSLTDYVNQSRKSEGNDRVAASIGDAIKESINSALNQLVKSMQGDVL